MKSLMFLLFALPLFAAEPTLSEQLRDALYIEEVERKPAAAAETYAKILHDFDSQRPLAATALFRLAEIRRNAGDSDRAIALYQRLLREFSDRETEADFARQHLATLGGEVPITEGKPTLIDEQETEIQRLKHLAETAPDLFHSRDTIMNAVENGHERVVEYLLTQGVDPVQHSLLSTAAEKGFLNVCRLLIENGTYAEGDFSYAVEKAIRAKHHRILIYLLEQGASPSNSESYVCPLFYAVLHGNIETLQILIEHGADVNQMGTGLPSELNYVGTPLHAATYGRKSVKIVRFLLENGAKPDLLDPNYGLSPLHFAVAHYSPTVDRKFNQGYTFQGAIVTELLKYHSDLNRVTSVSESESRDLGWNEKEFAFVSATPLSIAWSHSNLGAVEELIQAGANLTPADLEFAVQSGEPKLLELVLERLSSFDFDKSFQEQLFRSANLECRDHLNRRFVIPQMTEAPAVQLLLDRVSEQRRITLMEQSDTKKLPSLSQAILESGIALPYSTSGDTHHKFTLWRRVDDGELESISLDFAGEQPLPALQWGDVIEHRAEAAPNIEYRSLQHFALSWELIRRLSIPFTLTVGEETREITIRGDRLVYDPTLPEVPWRDAESILRLLRPAASNSIKVTIQRDGWQDVVTELNSKTLEEFRIRPGDHIHLEADSIFPMKAEEQKQYFTLRVPGTDHIRLFPVEPQTSSSLVEVLSLALSSRGHIGVPVNLLKDPEEKISEIHRKVNRDDYDYPVVLSHPDLSKIVIHRTGLDGETTAIPVDLSAAIARVTEATTSEEARRADPILEPGDVIDLPLKSSKKVWTGFTSQQALWFHKVLSGKIMVTYGSGAVIQHQINWQPPRWTLTGAGLLPFAPERGISSTRADYLFFGNDIKLTREGEELSDLSGALFLRANDKVVCSRGSSRFFQR